MDSKILDHFKDELLRKFIEETKQYIRSTLVKEINQELYTYGTHYDVGDGIGFDYSLTQAPKVTDDQLLTVFLNGTFYGDDAQMNGGPIYETNHPVFEIGANGHQDIMLHVSQSVLESGMNTLIGKGESGFSISNWW
jgi:hypothetical protein